MSPLVIPILSAAVELFKQRQPQIAKQTGVPEEAVSKVGAAFESYLNKEERQLSLAAEHMEQARKHAAATLVGDIWLVNLLRGLVRPVTTFAALGWYIYARVMGIELLPEDYAIIGGILAFWFGFRPFEKRQK